MNAKDLLDQINEALDEKHDHQRDMNHTIGLLRLKFEVLAAAGLL